MSTTDAILLSDRDRAIVRQVLAPHASAIERVSVFGSRALGTARPASDIDLVLWASLDDAAIARLWTRFDESGLAVSVDLVRYDAALSEPLRRHIDRVARPLFTHDDLRA